MLISSLLQALALSVLAATTDATASATITPPTGWVALNSELLPRSVIGAWGPKGSTPAEGFGQNINLISQKFSGTLDAYAASSVVEAARVPSVKIEVNREDTSCSDVPAHFVSATFSMLSKDLHTDQVLIVANGQAFVATYTRLITQPALPEAIAALHSLCPSKATSAT